MSNTVADGAQHMALYRRWRPLTFSDVYGQAHITRALMTQVQAEKTSHAYLFTGTRGTGKTTCAKILARAVNCLNPVDGNPCNTCPSCLAALEESALDITEVDAASMSGVDNIREIREEAFFAPTALKKRVYIIDEVHMLSTGAFNALLKTLEEPPGHVLFILATTEIHKVPATILSRCQRYDFRRIPAEIIAQRLTAIAQAEGSRLAADAADLLAARGDGSFRDAISLLDRAMTPGDITRESVESALGLAGNAQVHALLAAILDSDAAGALNVFTRSYMAGQDMISLFDSLLSLLRDIYVIQVTGGAGLLLSAGQDEAALRDMAGRADAALLEYLVSCVSDLLRRLTRTAIRRTDGEMCILKMCLRHRGAPEGFIFSPGSMGQPAPVAAARAPIAAPAAAPAKTAAPAMAAVPADELPWATEPGADDNISGDPAPIPEVAAQEPAPAEPQETAEPAQAEAPAGAAPASANTGADSQLRSLVAAVAGQVNSAVRTYLSLATARNIDNTLHIQVAEESLVFMDKPAVLETLNTAAKGLGLSGVNISDQPPKAQAAQAPKGPVNPAADILSRARNLGVTIRSEDGQT